MECKQRIRGVQAWVRLFKTRRSEVPFKVDPGTYRFMAHCEFQFVLAARGVHPSGDSDVPREVAV